VDLEKAKAILYQKHQRSEVEVKTKDSLIANLNCEMTKVKHELEEVKAEKQ
jgi:hypothetical protein